MIRCVTRYESRLSGVALAKTEATNNESVGSVRQIIDCQAEVVKLYTYNPFGELIEEEGTFDNPFRFTGQYYDSEIDQYYLRARQYDPHLGRFTGRDLILGDFAEPITLHRYLYCGNDPLNRIDPYGLMAYYITSSVMAEFGYSVSGQGGIVWDDKGNWGIISIEGEGGGIAGISAGVSIGITNAEDILALRGSGWSLGASGGYGFLSGGAEFIWSTDPKNTYEGIEFNLGVGLSYPKVEGHLQKTFTRIIPAESKTLTFERILGQVANEAFWNIQTYGEGRYIMHLMAITDMDMASTIFE